MDIDGLLCQFQRRWWPLCTPFSPQENMFNLMSNCCSWVSKIQEPFRKVTILVVGLDKAGKTCAIRGMSKAPHGGEAGPTQECIRNELRLDNYLVTLLDVGGSEELRGTWRELYGEAHGIIFVLDSSDKQRIKEVKEVLVDLLKEPRVSGKPLLVLANKQDKMNALLGNELIEILSLEKLVNESRSLCHIEPCSALMDLRRWPDRRTQRGLRWLLRAVYMDYPELCARVAQDRKRPVEARREGKSWKTGKMSRKTKRERIRSSKSDFCQVHRQEDKERKAKGEGKLQPIRNMLRKENSLKKKTKRKKKRPDIDKEGGKSEQEANDQEEEEEGDANEGEQDNSGHRERASSALIPKRKSKVKRKTKVKEESLDMPKGPDNNQNPLKEEKMRRKKVVKVKRKNKINAELSAASSQPVDLSATLDLYRKAILALKERQDQGQRA
ncbi:ADP-ribosylation factor-like protein 13A isoform X1 [Takifugu rubripes]|uniref:ADP-ribosylation factor-like 13A n=1 Tax=Takifugu rubripes TaxID=31033 RepID=H2U3D5_TAKRU|nr:ADP-ribosylation factor-like protein 13A isoform X1 [Takifugu rubripes]